jgi:hypothetical protein
MFTRDINAGMKMPEKLLFKALAQNAKVTVTHLSMERRLLSGRMTAILITTCMVEHSISF